MPTYIDATLAARQAFMRHFDAELASDLDGTLATVARHPTYALAQRAGGPGAARMLTLDHCDAVRDFYASQLEVVGPVALRVLTNVSSDWYEFVENVPTRRRHQPETADGSINSVTLIPVSGECIQGEFLWERTACADNPEQPRTPETLAADGTLPMTRLRNATIHEQYLDALRQGDVEELIGRMVEHPLWAARSYAPDAGEAPLIAAEGRSGVREILRAWTDAFDVHHVSVLTRVATDWYVFAEELYTVSVKVGALAGVRREFRNAAFYPISANGLIEGAMGYGTDLVEPSARSSTEVGRVTYTAEGYADPLEDLSSSGA